MMNQIDGIEMGKVTVNDLFQVDRPKPLEDTEF